VERTRLTRLRQTQPACLLEGNAKAMEVPAEQAAISLARRARQRCICQEEVGAPPCDCAAPVTREQVGRLHAYLQLGTGRAIIYSESASEWLAALRAFLPACDDPFEGWLREPFKVPPAADLRHASDLGTLLDMLGAPPVAALS
jgi:hypothetical protein